MICEVTQGLALDVQARDGTWCLLPYPRHPKGCPKFGKRPSCPPQAPFVGDFIELSKPHWFVIVAFNLRRHKQRMALQYPDWSDAQTGCVLYWQGGVRTALTQEAQRFSAANGCCFTTCPEAMGVNVIRTIRSLGLEIETSPTLWVKKVALVGYSRGAV